MPASVNINLVSPSGVGDYAGCPMKLVYDTDYPVPREPNPWADFGTLAHYLAMYRMGLNPPEVKDAEMIEASARTLYGNNETRLVEALDKATIRAVASVPKLPPGIVWVPEVRKHDPRILPERVSRSGEQGYGGIIDLMASDRSILVDFKFVGRPPDKVKLAYLWQMASYYLVSGITKCMLLFTTRDSKIVTTCTLDFTQPLWQVFAERVGAFINYTGHADFRRNAFFCEGDQCTYCNNKKRCPLQAKPGMNESLNITVPTKADACMDSMLAVVAANKANPPPAAPVKVPSSIALF